MLTCYFSIFLHKTRCSRTRGTHSVPVGSVFIYIHNNQAKQGEKIMGKTKIVKIISGGQTGADRAGLDAAIELEIPFGGWCTNDRRAEDGMIPAKYKLKPTTSDNYVHRTRMNVFTSDATVIFCLDTITRGSVKTVEFTKELKKPYFVFKFSEDLEDSKIELISWLESLEKPDLVLNVAGSRESSSPGLYNLVREVIPVIVKFVNI